MTVLDTCHKRPKTERVDGLLLAREFLGQSRRMLQVEPYLRCAVVMIRSEGLVCCNHWAQLVRDYLGRCQPNYGMIFGIASTLSTLLPHNRIACRVLKHKTPPNHSPERTMNPPPRCVLLSANPVARLHAPIRDYQLWLPLSTWASDWLPKSYRMPLTGRFSFPRALENHKLI